MLTGSVPFKGDTAFSVALKHKTQLPQDPRKLNSQLSDDLSRLILVCMEKDRERRYQTAADLLADLQNIEEGFPLGTEIKPKRKTFIKALIRKRLFIPASIIALTIIGVLLWLTVFRKGILPTASSQHSVAVLPFLDLSPQKDYEWLSDGMSEAMINALSNLKGLRVPARTSSFFFKGKEVDIQEISQKLKVENVLEGSVQVAGDKLRVSAQLISIKDGYHLWSDKFDLRLEDVFSIQDEIAREIVRALKVKLLGEEEIKLTKRYTENLEAYNLYLKGRYFWNKRGRENLYKSIEYFVKTIEKDPNYALAYAALADSYHVLGNNVFIPPGEAYPKAREFTLKALEIDNRLAEAHAALANIKTDYDWDWTGAEKEYKIALQINPYYGYAHQGYAFLLTYLGRHEEAIKEIKTARDLDPLAPRISANVGYLYYFARMYEQAHVELKKAMELHPSHAAIYNYASLVCSFMGRHEEALAYYQKLRELTQEEVRMIFEARTFAKWGKRKEVEELLPRISEHAKKTYISLEDIASIHALLGDIDKAFLLLDRAYSEREPRMCFLKVEPLFDSLRSDPRFKALLKKMNLE